MSSLFCSVVTIIVQNREDCHSLMRIFLIFIFNKTQVIHSDFNDMSRELFCSSTFGNGIIISFNLSGAASITFVPCVNSSKIAKKGRKYGITLVIVSQRPSEISETIFSQCINFVVMRLTNPQAQNYVQRLLLDNIGNVTNSLPSLGSGHAILIGDSIVMSSLLKIEQCSHESDSVGEGSVGSAQFVNNLLHDFADDLKLQ